MEIKQIKKIGFFLGLSFVLFNNSLSLAACSSTDGPGMIACLCQCCGPDPDNTGVVYVKLGDQYPADACNTCMRGTDWDQCTPTASSKLKKKK